MIEQVYRIGYVTREKERDYDPMGSAGVCEAIEKWEELEAINADLLEALEEAVASFSSTHGNCPAKWTEAISKAKGEL